MRYATDRSRIHEWDAVRGFALCGVLVVDIWQIADLRVVAGPDRMIPVRHALSVVFEGRFLPIIAFVFGVSFALMLDRTAEQADRPWVVPARRLAALGAIGLVHHQFHPDEALLPYALAGMLILLPASALPDWAVLGGGVLGIVAVAPTLGGGYALVPGLFLLGAAAVRYGIAETLDEHGWQIAAVFALAVPAAVLAARWEYRTPYLDLWSSPAAPVAGLLGALAYLTGLLLVLRTDTGLVLAEVLEPLGRMALTNYLAATAVVLLAGPRLGLPGSDNYAAVLGSAVVLIAAEAIVSAVWLRFFRYGPVEWLWRCVTWWEFVPMRRVRVPSR